MRWEWPCRAETLTHSRRTNVITRVAQPHAAALAVAWCRGVRCAGVSQVAHTAGPPPQAGRRSPRTRAAAARLKRTLTVKRSVDRRMFSGDYPAIGAIPSPVRYPCGGRARPSVLAAARRPVRVKHAWRSSGSLRSRTGAADAAPPCP